MSETLYGDIRAALTERLQTLPDLIDVAWENDRFTPSADTPYLEPVMLWAEATQAELGEDGSNWERGIFQITMHYPQNTGIGAQTDMAGRLRNHFKRGTVLTYNGVTVKTRKAYLNPTGNVLSIAFYCYAAN